MRQLSNLILCLFCISSLIAGAPALSAEQELPKAGIASAHPLATQAGYEVLQKGGNAFDAAVAISAALAVVEPSGSGLGGGGFWLLHRAKDGFEVMVDGRETAPARSTKSMYLNKQGEPIAHASLNGPLAAAIPGEPAALVHIAQRYGRLPLSVTLAPAIRYAENGFKVSPRYQKMTMLRQAVLQQFPEAAKVFLINGEVPDTGAVIRQKDLAQTLKLLSRNGHKGFYDGEVARKLVSGVRRAGGIWRLQDLKDYKIVERQPVTGSYRNLKITAAALPSSGGLVLMEMFNILSGFELSTLTSYQRAHLIIEAMRLAYHDRASYLGDPDFVSVDTVKLLSLAHADRLRKIINLNRALSSETLPARVTGAQGIDTSHFSVIDSEGNRVAATLSINYPFGSGFMPPGTGVVLNNEMDDFSIKPGVANVYGLIGNEANAIEPGKRPLSSMTPTFLETPDSIVVMGTPGGSRIITMVLLAALEVADKRGGPGEWVALPRFHHQYMPDQVFYEAGAFSDADIRYLEKLGHDLQVHDGYGNMQVVMLRKKDRKFESASDPRGEGAALTR
ncbi:MAG: gamma-glutamyltransferase [Gammaproteobacteria bacterium]|nr:gamma-glutamyltransferase [Gammaproteobacteria bacterium]